MYTTNPEQYYPTIFNFKKSLNVTMGYVTYDENYMQLDFSSSGEIFSDFDISTLGRPIFNINESGRGYFVWSGYKGDGSSFSHSLHYTYTEDYGESWYHEDEGDFFHFRRKII